MRFFTKDWYTAMNVSGIFRPLKAEQEAEIFSEAYYRRAYREEKAAFLSLYARGIESSAEGTRLFAQMCRSQKNRLKRVCPEWILTEVADIRVLALGRCSAAVKEKLEAFSDDCRRNTKAVCSAYAAYEKEQFAACPPPFLKNFQFHDNRVCSFCKNGTERLLTFEDTDREQFPKVKRIHFRNTSVVRQERPLAGAWWLYEEVHKTDTGYEIHILLDKKGLFECVVACEDVLLEWDFGKTKISPRNG